MKLLVGLFLIFSMALVPWRLRYDGYPKLLTNLRSEEVNGEEYSKIRNIGHGLFYLRNISSNSRKTIGNIASICDANLNKITYSIPKDCTLEKVLYLGKEASKNKSLQINYIPEDSLFAFWKNGNLRGGMGICDTKGNTLVSPIYQLISWPSEGFVFLHYYKNSVRGIFAYDLIGKKILELGSSRKFNHRFIFFSDGLLLFRDPQKNKFGYLDKNGKVAIKAKFLNAKPFINGRACANVWNKKYKRNSYATIDKKGKVVSPSSLEVFQFCGNYAIARKINKNSVSKYGVVDSNFQFIIEPKYDKLIPIFEDNFTSSTVNPFGIEQCKSNPLYFIGKHNNSDSKIVLKPNGTELYSIQTDKEISFVLEKNIVCKVESKEMNKYIVLDKEGKNKSTLYFSSTKAPYSLKRISKNRLLKSAIDSGLFDRQYWQNKCIYPINRQEMLFRFFDEYKLIGMERSNVLKYLGKPKTRNVRFYSRFCKELKEVEKENLMGYSLYSGGCILPGPGLFLILENEKVKDAIYVDGRTSQDAISYAKRQKRKKRRERPMINFNYNYSYFRYHN